MYQGKVRSCFNAYYGVMVVKMLRDLGAPFLAVGTEEGAMVVHIPAGWGWQS